MKKLAFLLLLFLSFNIEALAVTEFKCVVDEGGSNDYTSLIAWEAANDCNLATAFTTGWDNEQVGTIADGAAVTWGVDGEGTLLHITTVAKSGADTFLLIKDAGNDPADDDTVTDTTNSFDVDGTPDEVKVSVEITGTWTNPEYEIAINGWDTSVVNTITIEATGSARQDGTGVWSTTAWRADVTRTYRTALRSEDHCFMYGLQLEASSYGNSYPLGIYAGSHAGYCLIINGSYSIDVEGVGGVELYNLIIYNSSIGIWIRSWRAPKIYNSTISDCTTGILKQDSNGDQVPIENCAVFNNGTDFNDPSTEFLIDYCASDDGDGNNPIDISPGGTEADDWNNAFTDYANRDFTIKAGSVLINAGTDDPSGGTYSDDFIGTARSSPWDVGAYEFVSAAPTRRMLWVKQ